MDGSRTANTEALRTFMRIATALWLVGALTAVMDGDAPMFISWSCLAACGALIAGGLVHRSRGIAYLAIALLVVGVVISVGVSIVD